MTFKDYQEKAWEFALPNSRSFNYLVPALAAEAGEIAGKWAKFVRGDGLDVFDKEELSKELGDVMWMVAGLATLINQPLEFIAFENIDKLQDRQQRGVLQGNGDTR